MVTLLLERARDGDEGALDELFPLVYDALRSLSRRELHRAGSDQTLCTTELIHESYLKLIPGTEVAWNDRQHFFRVASRAMRQVLVDRARRRASERQKEDRLRVTVSGRPGGIRVGWDELLDLDRALRELARANARLHDVVELRFFGGLTEDEVAEMLEVSSRTIRRDWVKARLFLHCEMYPGAGSL
jgi:RNA polymerase sigma factor (TIGR02999 family)